MDHIFVGREAELSILSHFLHLSLGGNTEVCFVTGEAGSGKTHLIKEFVRRSESLSGNLLFVKGNCNDQSGISAPYLPFRSILGMLSGDNDNINAITTNNAQRLNSVLRTSGRALVEVAPELVGTLIPGAGILVALARLGAKEKGWLKALEARAQVSEQRANDIKQPDIFLQYTAFLKDLAKTYSLVLILEDLQWVDAASNALFFHLARELKDAPILFIGTARLNDVAVGREGNRHPFEKTLNEVKRIYGNISVDLDASMHQNGRSFVEALVNREPNHLSTEFIDTLFKKTRGHALFTTELLYSMQERGSLIQDANGLWQESSQLNWEGLPARVEAIVEERIERLDDNLRTLLDIACVEGQDFTAQVIAKIQDLGEREVIRKLSHELAHCHQLVQELGEISVRDTFLSRYTFSHGIFQAYLYSRLSAAERRLFHAQVARILESLYSENIDNVAAKLALHYLKSCNLEKSAIYLQKNGEYAFKLGDFVQAISFFEQAINSLQAKSSGEKNIQKAYLHWRIGESYRLNGYPQKAYSSYKKCVSISKEIDDKKNIARGLIGLARILKARKSYEASISAARIALKNARNIGSKKIESQALRTLGLIYGSMDKLKERRAHLEKALLIADESDDLIEQRACINNLGVLASSLGEFKTALNYYERALSLTQREESITKEPMYLANIGVIYGKIGDYSKAKDCLTQSLKHRQKFGLESATWHNFHGLGVIDLRSKNIPESFNAFKKSKSIADKYKHSEKQAETRHRIVILHLIQNHIDKALQIYNEKKTLDILTKDTVCHDSLLEAILYMRQGEINLSRKLLEDAKEEVFRQKKHVKRWSYHYHYAFIQVGLTLLALTEDYESYYREAIQSLQEAVEICGYVGILDDSLIIIKELQKIDSDNRLQPIENYLFKKRELAWKNRNYSDEVNID